MLIYRKSTLSDHFYLLIHTYLCRSLNLEGFFLPRGLLMLKKSIISAFRKFWIGSIWNYEHLPLKQYVHEQLQKLCACTVCIREIGSHGRSMHIDCNWNCTYIRTYTHTHTRLGKYVASGCIYQIWTYTACSAMHFYRHINYIGASCIIYIPNYALMTSQGTKACVLLNFT